MKELEKEFIGAKESKGFKFKQVVADEYGYIYSVFCHSEGIAPDDVPMYYEVFKRKEQKESTSVIGGKECHFEAKVRYPTSNDFGVWAWVFRDNELYKAMQKLETFKNESDEKQRNTTVHV